MAAEHSGAMAVGGETRGGPTCARKAEQARARLQGRRGGVAGARNWRMARWCGSLTPAELGRREGGARGSRLWRRRRGSAGVSERARGHQQVKAGAWARCQATAAARRASPAQGGHAAGKLCRGRDARRGASASRRAEAGQRGAGLGRGEARAGASLGRLAGLGRKGGGGPRKQKHSFQISIFNKFSNNSFQILF